jgi:hypothetical protein
MHGGSALARPATALAAPLPVGDPVQHTERSPARILWALLLVLIYEILVPAQRASRIDLH